MINGDAVPADHDYIVESIRLPGAAKAVGYAAGNMPAFGEQALPPGDVEAIIEFMKSISSATDEKPLEAWPEGYNGAVYLAEYDGEPDGAGFDQPGGDQPAQPVPADEPLEGNMQRIDPESGVVQ